jgi:hypothetical protein
LALSKHRSSEQGGPAPCFPLYPLLLSLLTSVCKSVIWKNILLPPTEGKEAAE